MECVSYDSVWSLRDAVIKLAAQLSNESVRKRPSKSSRTGYEYVLYTADVVIHSVNKFITDEYETIWIEDYNPRRFAASLLVYLTIYGYYMPHL
jgi:hypothetical protein